MIFEYGTAEVEHLRKRDQKLGEAIDRIGPLSRAVDTDLFASVVRHILGQQISTAAQATLWARLERLVGAVTPDSLASLTLAELQGLGTTFKKAGYIQAFTAEVQGGGIDLQAVALATDADAIRTLSAFKGIGVWTAEMILLFGLQRPDILSYGDLAILRGMRMLYRRPSIDRDTFTRYAKRYSPCGTVASLYLWAIAAGMLPDLTDPATPKKPASEKPKKQVAAP